MIRLARITTKSIFFVVVLSLSLQASALHERGYILAVVPQFPKLIIHHDWVPFIKRLSAETGVQIQLRHYRNITAFGEGIMNGEPDIAYMNAYQLISSRQKQGYIPLIRDDTRMLKGIIIVRRDSNIKNIYDIDGKIVAFPAPNAFGASLFIRATLAKMKISVLPHIVVTHANVYRHVIKGFIIAGGGVRRTYDRESKIVKAQLRILFETPGVPSHPLAAHPRVPEKLREKIITSILSMAKVEKYRQLLTAVQLPKPVRADYKKDYQSLKRLRLYRYILDGRL